jgi:hypothetical protein
LGRFIASFSSAADDHGPSERGIEPFVWQTPPGHQLRGTCVIARRVVLMQAVDGHALGRRPRRLGQGRAPGLVPLVADPHPIDRAQDDRLRIADEHDPPAAQSIIDPFGRLDGPPQAAPKGGVAST